MVIDEQPVKVKEGVDDDDTRLVSVIFVFCEVIATG